MISKQKTKLAMAASALAAVSLFALTVIAQEPSTTSGQNPRPGGKNRIVFDVPASEAPEATPSGQQASPSPTPAAIPSPSPSLTPENIAVPLPTIPPPAVEEIPPEPEAAPTSTPEPVSSPSPQPASPGSVSTATVAEATPEPTPVPAATPAVPALQPPSPGDVIAESAASEPSEDAAKLVEGQEAGLPTRDVVRDAEELDLAPLAEDGPPSPSQSVTANLIRKLVEKGILTKQDAEAMIRQAEAEAEVARSQAQSDMFAIAQLAAAQAAADQAALTAAVSAPSEEDVNVVFIPEPVRTQIKEDIKTELMAGGNQPFRSVHGPLPRWVETLTPFGDIRVRFESIVMETGNDATGAFPNFNAINTGLPFDVTGNQFAPQLNADQDRYRFRLRARLGLGVDLADNFSMGFRLATGNDNSPVSTNQSFGAASGQGGQFSKYAIWLDRAFLKYTLWGKPERNFEIWAGRFDNPFFGTALVWDDDLGFDGFAARIKYEVLPGFRPYLTGGAFPVYNTDLNFSSNQPTKFKSYDKYLFAVQGGFEWSFAKDWEFKVGTAYYHFYNIEGKLSSPFTPLSQNDAGDTDNSRPSFAQKGNTYFPIRNIVPDASNDFGAINQWQYYGLATKFQNLAVTARLDYNGWKPAQVSLLGEFVTNLSWNRDDINLIAVNNRGDIDPDDIDSLLGDYEGDRYGWLVELRVGMPRLTRRWDWSAHFGYRWIGSDAVVDGFNDSDFGLGGTNMQGFTAAASLALAPNIWLTGRWMGSDSIAGPQYNINIFQVDLNGQF